MTGTIKCLKCGHTFHCKVEDDYPDSSGMPSGCMIESNCPKCDGDSLEILDAEHDDPSEDYWDTLPEEDL
jgi:hypothetical protein